MSNSYKYYPLTPKVLDEKDELYQVYCVYRDALDQAYSNQEIRNIAITGPYGSGKSSVWNTYRMEKKKQNKSLCAKDSGEWGKNRVITVALSEFKGIDTEGQIEESSEKLNQSKINNIEEQIINQILYQVDPSKVPWSKYEVKSQSESKIQSGTTCLIIMFLLGIFLNMEGEKIKSILFLQISSVWPGFLVTIFMIMFISCPIFYLIHRLIKKYKLFFNQINFKGNSIDLKDTEKDVLNDEMREIVYIIDASEVHTVVFEDIDRFNDLDLFVKLRELNFLVNAVSKNVVRFVYLLRDDLFLEKERTKFFDLIIPIVPVINSQNSSGKLLSLFEEDPNVKMLKPSTWVLESVSLYIDDMRLLYSIRNEYEVYSQVINLRKRALNPDKLFGIIVFKNIFPQEFDQFQQNKGYVYHLIKKIEEVREEYLIDLKTKKEGIQENIKELRLEITNTKYEMMALNIPARVAVSNDIKNAHWVNFLQKWALSPHEEFKIYHDRGYSWYNYTQFYEKYFDNEEFSEKLSLFQNTDKKESIKIYEKKLSSLENKINNIYSRPTHEVLLELNEKDLEDFFIISNDDKANQEINYNLPSNHYFGLIRFLFYEGLLDETYPDYLGYFYESTIGINDEIFIRNLRDGTATDEKFKLDNPQAVKDKLREVDYKKKGIYNHDLILAMLRSNDSYYLTSIIDMTVKNNEKVRSLILFIDSLDNEKINQLVQALLVESFELFWDLLEKSKSAQSLHHKMLAKLVENIDILKEQEKNIELVRDYIETKSSLLTYTNLINNENFYQGLEKAEIRFENITETNIDSEVAFEIEQRNLFLLTIQNIVSVYCYKTGEEYDVSVSKLLDILYNTDILQSTWSKMQESLDDYMKEYIAELKRREKRSNSTSKAFIKILNTEISNESKQQLILLEDSVISDLSLVENNDLWSDLLESSKVEFNQTNINSYYENVGVDLILIEYLNENSHFEEFRITNVDLANSLVQDERIDDRVFDEAFKQSDKQIQAINPELLTSSLKNRIEKFVWEDRVDLSKENYLILQEMKDENLFIHYLKRYPEEVDSFIGTEVSLGEVTDNAFNIILNNKILGIDRSKELIDKTNRNHSLFDIPYAHYEVRQHIIKKCFDENDIDKIINSESFDLWDEFIMNVNKHRDFLNLILECELNPDFVTRFMGDDALEEPYKILMLEYLIKNKLFVMCWREWMLNSESGSLVDLGEVLNKKRRPEYPINSSIKNIVDLLIDMQVITHGRDNRLHFSSKEFNDFLEENNVTT